MPDELGKPFEPVANLIGPDIAEAVDRLKLHESGATTERPARGPDRYSIRHVGVDLKGEWLMIYFTCVGRRPERIICTAVDLQGPPKMWTARGAFEVLRPAMDWEGVKLPLVFSKGGVSRE